MSNGRRNWISLAVIVSFGLLAAGSMDTDTDTNAVQSKETSYTLTADELYRDYNANEVAADMKYKGKVVVVVGEVESIGKDIMDQAFIVIGGRGGFLSGAQCTFTKAENLAVAQLSKGRTVTVKCEVTGKMGNVQLDKCQLR